ncbi:MAG: tellurite resistance TerB family protein [Microcoleaceae cyanobacterium]
MSTASQTANIQLSPAEAFAAIALTAVAADGYVTGSETQIINTTLSRMQLFSEYSEEEKRSMIDRLFCQIQQQGYDTLMTAAIAQLPGNLKETVFAIATDITLADGELSEEEENLLNALYSSLEISEEMATKIIDVMLIKNRG